MTNEALMSADIDVSAREPDREVALPQRPVWVYLAFAFTMLFTTIHVYWAVGGTWGLPLARRDHRSEVKAANWVVSAIMVLGALYVLALLRPIARRPPAWTVLAPIWIAAVVCISHSIYGFVTKALYLGGWHDAVDFPVVSGVSAVTAADKNQASAVLDLAVFEPCFLLQGVLLALAGWQFIRTRRRRNIWSRSMIVGIAVIDVFGAVLSLGGNHVAV